MILFVDSLFSMIIFLYMMVTCLYVFYAFCFRDPAVARREERARVEKSKPAFTEDAGIV